MTGLVQPYGRRGIARRHSEVAGQLAAEREPVGSRYPITGFSG